MPNKNSLRAARWNRLHPERAAAKNNDWRLRRFYGIEKSDLEFMRSQQNGKCAIASCPNQAEHIDHDHATGKVRGLLCKGCNMLLGVANDSPQFLRDAAQYLEDSLRRELKGGTPLPVKPRRKVSDEQRAVLRTKMLGNTFRLGLPGPNKGKTHLPETIKKLSAARKAWWESRTEEEREVHREYGRHNAKKRWGP